jgi:hypothetical protein
MKYNTIGNGTFAAAMDQRGRCVWCCLDHFGGDPIFNSLANNNSSETGFFDIAADNFVSCTQEYVPLTAVLVTKVTTTTGVFEIVDFAPKFKNFDREGK